MQGGIDLTILSLLIEKKTKAASMSKSTRGPKKHQHTWISLETNVTQVSTAPVHQ
jgi:hypothetical protein